MRVKVWDVIIIGGGIIGLSLAISLRKQGLRVLIVERGMPGREASSAAAGMLVGSGKEIPPELRRLAEASANMYREFVHELEDESGDRVDLREQGTILLLTEECIPEGAERLSEQQLRSLEPCLGLRAGGHLHPHESSNLPAAFLAERSLDPRALVAAAVKAAKHRGVDISSGNEVKKVLVENGRACGIEAAHGSYHAGTVVNCAGAWAGCVAPENFPVRPVKGQMLALVGGPALKHVVRSENVYLVPRSDGRIVIGSTIEDVGYDKRAEVSTIQRLFKAALEIAPRLDESRIHEDWAGLRPGTPDNLPVLGESSTSGYFVAAGHYRDGILLAPITAEVVTGQILRNAPTYDLAPFSPARFGSQGRKN